MEKGGKRRREETKKARKGHTEQSVCVSVEDGLYEKRRKEMEGTFPKWKMCLSLLLTHYCHFRGKSCYRVRDRIPW